MLIINGVEFTLADRVLETTQTSGSGSYSLDGVSTDGRQSFLTAIGDGVATSYVVQRGTVWEVGIGTVSAGTPVTLSRDLILGTSSNPSIGATAINWPTTDAKEIFVDVPAALLNQLYDIRPGDANTALIVRNDNDTQVVQLRVTDTGDGAVTVRNVSDVSTVQLRARFNSRGSLQLNDFEVYPLSEGLGTPSTSTGAVTKLFSGIRTDARRITVMISATSINGLNELELALGDAGGIETSGYVSIVEELENGSVTQTEGPTNAFRLTSGCSDLSSLTGTVVLTLLNSTTNLWIMTSHIVVRTANVSTQLSGGSKALSAAITQLRLQASGSDVFDVANVNILVE